VEARAAETHRELIARETLAVSIAILEGQSDVTVERVSE